MSNENSIRTQTSRDGRAASHDALTVLEDALAAPSPTRVRQWHAEVVHALDELIVALDHQAGSDQHDDSLLSEIARDSPRFAPRVERLHSEHDDLRASAVSLRTQIAVDDTHTEIDVGDIRDRLAAIAHRYRQHRAREADLVFEAINVDLGGGD